MWGINDRSSTPLARLGWLIQLLHKRPLSTTHSDSCLHSCRTNAISDQYHGPDHERCSVPGDGSPHHGSLIHNQAMDWPGDLHQPLKDDPLIHDCVMRCMTPSSQVDIPPPLVWIVQLFTHHPEVSSDTVQRPPICSVAPQLLRHPS